MKSVAEKITEMNHVVAVPQTIGPRNHLGEAATRTPGEAIARLQEKATRNQGGANRRRIQAQISEERRVGDRP